MADYNPVEQLNSMHQPWPLLKEGVDTWFVKLLRRTLAFHGDGDKAWLKPAAPVSSVFDKELTGYVRAFQKAHKIKMSGEVGPATWAALALYEKDQGEPAVDGLEHQEAHPDAEAQLRSAIVSRAEALAAQKIREKQGQNKGEPFETYNRYAGVPSGSPYCVTLWNYELAQLFHGLGYKLPFTIGARSSVLVTLARKAGRLKGTAQAQPGDLIVFRNKPGVVPTHFHTGLIVRVLGGGIFETVEGNTGAGKGVIGEGDGIYRRRRDSNTAPADIVDVATIA